MVKSTMQSIVPFTLADDAVEVVRAVGSRHKEQDALLFRWSEFFFAQFVYFLQDQWGVKHRHGKVKQFFVFRVDDISKNIYIFRGINSANVLFRVGFVELCPVDWGVFHPELCRQGQGYAVFEVRGDVLVPFGGLFLGLRVIMVIE